MGIVEGLVNKANAGLKEKVQEGLKYASQAVDYALTMPLDAKSRATLTNVKGKIGEMSKVLSKYDTAIKNYNSAMKIVHAAADLRGDIRADPQRSARAFGKLFSGIGELSHYLPPPINGYFGIFKDAENFFVTLQAQMQPDVHFRGANKQILDADPVP